MEIRVDIDETLCCNSPAGVNEPVNSIIAKVNRFGDEGHTIVLWTSRPESFREETEAELEAWNVWYDELIMDKPSFDLLVDDKAVNVLGWMRGDECGNASEWAREERLG